MDSRDSHILLSDSESFHPNRPTPPPLRSISPMTESPAPSPVRLRTFDTESECSLSQLAAATATAADRSPLQPSRLVCVIQPRVQPNLPPEAQRQQQTQRARFSMKSPARAQLAQLSDRERTHSKSYPVSKRVYVPPKPLPEEESPSSEEHYCQCNPRAAGPLMSPSKSHSVFGFGVNFRTASATGTRSFNEDCSRNAGWTAVGGLESRSYTLPPPTRRNSGVGALAHSHSGSKTGPRAHTRTSATHRTLPREQHAAAREFHPPTPSGRSRGVRASESDGVDMYAGGDGDGDGERDGESESCALDSALGPPPPPPEVRQQRALKYSASRRSLSDLEARRIYQPVARTVSIDLSPACDDTSKSTCRRRAPSQIRHPCFLVQRWAPPFIMITHYYYPLPVIIGYY